MTLGFDPAQAHPATSVTRCANPIGQARVLLRDHQRKGSVFLVLGFMLIEGDPLISIVKRLKPMIAKLEIPVIAMRRIGPNQQGVVRPELPISHIEEDVGIAVRGLLHIDVMLA